jgi:tRNA(fMet)-specific endonuclease VapC
MAFLLDTDIVSDVLRNPRGKTATKVLQSGVDRIGVSIIVAAELEFGIARRNATAFAVRLGEFLQQVEVLTFKAPADRIYGELRADLERRGKLIGPNDLLIAAHALALDRTLVTGNVREFSRIKSLRVENWLR